LNFVEFIFLKYWVGQKTGVDNLATIGGCYFTLR